MFKVFSLSKIVAVSSCHIRRHESGLIDAESLLPKLEEKGIVIEIGLTIHQASFRRPHPLVELV